MPKRRSSIWKLSCVITIKDVSAIQVTASSEKKTLQSRTTQKMKPSTSKRKKRLEIKKSRLKIVIEEKRNTFFVPKESSSDKVDIQLTVDGRLVSELGA